jgi:putative lipoprotein
MIATPVHSRLLTALAVVALPALLTGCGVLRATTSPAAPAAPGASALPPTLPSLAGTRWSTIPGASITDGKVPHLQLLADGQAIGSGGCNRFTGKWTTLGNTLRIGPLAATRMACPEPAMRGEFELFKALEATRSARSESGRLVLLDATGELLLALEPVR